MRVKKVNRYYCDFCKKSGCSAGVLKRHEDACTLNPNRKCGMCKAMGTCADCDERSVADLIKLIPSDLKDEKPWHQICVEDRPTWDHVDKVVAPVLAALREKAENCPVCIFSALRQGGAIQTFFGHFKLKDEIKARWDEINEAKDRAEVYY